jgi:hypothetical protein
VSDRDTKVSDARLSALASGILALRSSAAEYRAYADVSGNLARARDKERDEKVLQAWLRELRSLQPADDEIAARIDRAYCDGADAVQCIGPAGDDEASVKARRDAVAAWKASGYGGRRKAARDVLQPASGEKAVCGTCNGAHQIQVEVETVGHGCCGRFLSSGECCGNAVPVPLPSVDVQPCPDCAPPTEQPGLPPIMRMMGLSDDGPEASPPCPFGTDKAAGELLPCPWCAVPLVERRSGANPRAKCQTEGCFGTKLPVVNLDVHGDVAAWNRRPSPPTAPAANKDTDWILALAEGMKLANCDIKRVPIVTDSQVIADWIKEIVATYAAPAAGMTEQEREALEDAAYAFDCEAAEEANKAGRYQPGEYFTKYMRRSEAAADSARALRSIAARLGGGAK